MAVPTSPLRPYHPLIMLGGIVLATATLYWAQKILIPLALAVLLYGLMGSARGVSGIAMNTSLMEQVPRHFMGRVQNTFYFFGTFLQIALGLAVGWVASRVSLAAGFGMIAAVYAVAFGSACWPIRAQKAIAASAE